MHPNMPRMGTEGEQTLTGTQRHPVMSVSGKGAPYPWGTEGLGAENVLRVSAQGWRVAGLPNTPLPASWLPTSCAQGGTVPILRAGPGVPTMSQHGANRCQADVAIPRQDCKCDKRGRGAEEALCPQRGTVPTCPWQAGPLQGPQQCGHHKRGERPHCHTFGQHSHAGSRLPRPAAGLRWVQGMGKGWGRGHRTVGPARALGMGTGSL